MVNKKGGAIGLIQNRGGEGGSDMHRQVHYELCVREG